MNSGMHASSMVVADMFVWIYASNHTCTKAWINPYVWACTMACIYPGMHSLEKRETMYGVHIYLCMDQGIHKFLWVCTHPCLHCGDASGLCLLQFFSLSGDRECTFCSNKPETFVVDLQRELGASRRTEWTKTLELENQNTSHRHPCRATPSS